MVVLMLLELVHTSMLAQWDQYDTAKTAVRTPLQLNQTSPLDTTGLAWYGYY